MFEPFARIPKEKEKQKERPPRPGTPEWLEYLRNLPKGQAEGELEGPVVPFGWVEKKPNSPAP